MELITFRCTSCKQGLKIGADKAGRRVKCTRCGTLLLIPAQSESEPESAPTGKAKPAPPAQPPAKPSPFAYDEDEGAGLYTFKEALPAPAPEPMRRKAVDEDEDLDEEEKEEAAEIQQEMDEALRSRLLGLDEEGEDEEEEELDEEGKPIKRTRRRGTARLDPAVWQKVRTGLMVAVVSFGALSLALLLHEVYVLMGLSGKLTKADYPEVVKALHPHYQQKTDTEDQARPYLARLVTGIVSGLNNLDSSLVLRRISQGLMILQGLAMIVACVFCLSVPSDFAASGLALTTLIVAGVNLILGLVFRLLALVGSISFVLVPLLGPEISMLSANENRHVPISVLWSGTPLLQFSLTVFILIFQFMEYVLLALFLRSAGRFLRSLELEEKAMVLVKLGLAQAFVQVAYQVLATAGTSDVHGWVVKCTYCIGLGFFIGQIAYFITVLLRARVIIQKKLDLEEET